jgi:hypothetical protein
MHRSKCSLQCRCSDRLRANLQIAARSIVGMRKRILRQTQGRDYRRSRRLRPLWLLLAFAYRPTHVLHCGAERSSGCTYQACPGFRQAAGDEGRAQLTRAHRRSTFLLSLAYRRVQLRNRGSTSTAHLCSSAPLATQEMVSAVKCVAQMGHPCFDHPFRDRLRSNVKMHPCHQIDSQACLGAGS